MNVVFIAPFFRTATLRFVEAVASIDGVRVGLISQDPIEHIRPDIRARIDGHYRVSDGLDTQQLATAVRAMQRHFGRVDRLLGTLEHIQDQIAAVREICDIEGFRPQTAANFRDKNRMKEVLRAAGLPVARQRLVRQRSDARAFADEVGFPIVLKPVAGAAAVATHRVESREALESVLDKLQPSAQAPVQAEEFITGLERSFETASLGGKPVWCSYTRYTPQPLHVLENAWIQWTVTLPREEHSEELEAIQPTGLAAIKALGMQTGLTHLEWFLREDGSVAISEVAARPPGAQIMTLNSYALDVDMYRAWARLVVLGEWDVPPKKYATGCAFFRAAHPGRVTALRGVDRANEQVGALVIESRLPEIGWATSSGYEGDGYAIVRAESTEEVERALHVLVSNIRIETAV